MKHLFLTLIALGSLLCVQAQSIEVVKSFYRSDSTYAREKQYVEYKGKLYFLSPIALWVTDGTDTGTKKIASFEKITCLTAVNDGLIFMAHDFTHGWELWKSDGTIQGTNIVADIYPGKNQGCYMPNISLPLPKIADTVFFYADNGIDGIELWRSDGSSGGTFMLKDINDIPGKGLHYRDTIPQITVTTNNKILFQASDTLSGTEIWVSDGSSGGTKILKDISTSKDPGAVHLSNILLNFGKNTLFSSLGKGLYITDGTESNTVIISSPGLGPSSMDQVVYNNKMYFYSNGLVETDGTLSGTKKIRNIEGTAVAAQGKNVLLTLYKSKLFFAGHDRDSASSGHGIWESDGTVAGTHMIFYTKRPVFHMQVFNGKLFFKYLNEGADIVEVMEYDGNTVKSVSSMHPNIKINGNPFYPNDLREGVFVEYNNALFFEHEFSIPNSILQLCKLSAWPDNVTDNVNGHQIEIYPNPTVNEFIIKGNEIQRVTVMNIAGSTMHSSEVNSTQQHIDTRSWAPGIYLVTVENNSGETMRWKIVKQ